MPEPVIPDNVNVGSWKDLATDPGTAVVLGFVALLIPFLLIVAVPQAAQPIVALYPYFATGIVGLVTAHAWKDADKTKYLARSENPGAVE